MTNRRVEGVGAPSEETERDYPELGPEFAPIIASFNAEKKRLIERLNELLGTEKCKHFFETSAGRTYLHDVSLREPIPDSSNVTAIRFLIMRRLTHAKLSTNIEPEYDLLRELQKTQECEE